MKLFAHGAILASAIAIAMSAVPIQAATVVAPGQYAATDAPSAQFGILGNPSNSASTFQFIVAASELAGIATGSLISAIGFRFAGTPFTDPVGPASYSRYDIQIGSAATSAASPSSNFAANLGTDTILARTGAMTIPANSLVDLPGEGPNAFYDLGFMTPYTYAGGDLAVTLRFVPTSGNPGIALDAFAADTRINTIFGFGDANATSGTVGQAFAPVTRFTFAGATAVPEPASWAMLIAGFGLVGGALRRRRHSVAATFA